MCRYWKRELEHKQSVSSLPCGCKHLTARLYGIVWNKSLLLRHVIPHVVLPPGLTYIEVIEMMCAGERVLKQHHFCTILFLHGLYFGHSIPLRKFACRDILQ